jgi:hypothetical protein
VRDFARARPDWSKSVASTNAQGYVARGREWGLIESRQVQGRYALTPFGEEQLGHMTSAQSDPPGDRP